MRVLFGLTVLFIGFSQSFAAIANLSQGKTSYHLRGTNGTKNIVIVHGNTFSSWTSSGKSASLKRAGFNVLRFDMYGMGKSERLKTESYSRNHFFKQLEEIIEHVGWDKSSNPLYILGMSTGASIGAMYALKYPHRVAKLIAVSPALNVKSTRSLKLRAFVKIMKQFPESQTFRGMLKTRVEEGVDKLQGKISRTKMAFIKSRVRRILKTDYVDGLYRRLIGDSYNSYSLTYKKLGKMNFPMLIIGAELDEDSPEAHWQHISSHYHLPQFIETKVFKNVGSEMSTVLGRQIVNEILRYTTD